ncbi:MAG: hypothetical protein J6T31_07395 [Methanobrevibacter sp.]|nr:hypothetical protein [Methanobrevibacter sp.]
MTEFASYFLKAVISALAGVGVMEWLKNFIKTEKTWIYSLIMPFVAVGCFCSIEYLPIGVFGSIMTIGIMQIDYQLLVQGIQKVVKSKITTLSKSEE